MTPETTAGKAPRWLRRLMWWAYALNAFTVATFLLVQEAEPRHWVAMGGLVLAGWWLAIDRRLGGSE